MDATRVDLDVFVVMVILLVLVIESKAVIAFRFHGVGKFLNKFAGVMDSFTYKLLDNPCLAHHSTLQFTLSL